MRMYRFNDRIKTIVNLDNVLTIYGWDGYGTAHIVINFKDQKDAKTLYFNSKEDRDCELGILAFKKD